jgi:mannose-6-phosphate isomerase
MTEPAYARTRAASAIRHPPSAIRHPPSAIRRTMVLPPNRVPRFSAGGERIDALRGGPAQPGSPEEWVGSTTTSFGESREGLSVLADGRLLRESMTADPLAYLGAEHVERFGHDPALLVKILDAGERLPVHFHPGRAFARESLGLNFGKTGAWLIIDAEPGAVAHLGLTEPGSEQTLAEWVPAQDMAGCWTRSSRCGPHAPATCPWSRPAPCTPWRGDPDDRAPGADRPVGAARVRALRDEQRQRASEARLGTGAGGDRSRRCADPGHARLPPRQRRIRPAAGRGGEAAPYFRAQRLQSDESGVSLEPSFAILGVLEGSPVLSDQHGNDLALARGQTVLVPYCAGRTTLCGPGTVIRCLPPALEAGKPRW